MNAWPATHQLLVDGWLIRISNGFTKRANCVVPLYNTAQTKAQTEAAAQQQLLDKIRYCENLYAREQLQTVFRLTSASANTVLDTTLASRGYHRLDQTRVQVANLSQLSGVTAIPLPLKFQIVPAPEWLRAYSLLAEMPPTASELHANLIRSIRPDCAFAVLTRDDTPVACALGVLEHDLIGLFDVITGRSYRGQGLAQQLLTQLLQWGVTHGADHAYLQVIANNAPALALYARLGFEDHYSYWYRQTG